MPCVRSRPGAGPPRVPRFPEPWSPILASQHLDGALGSGSVVAAFPPLRRRRRQPAAPAAVVIAVIVFIAAIVLVAVAVSW